MAEEIADLLQKVTLDDTDSYEAFNAFLEEQEGFKNLSTAQKKKLFKKITSTTLKCLKCTDVYDSMKELRKHLKVEKHFFGQGYYRHLKRKLIHRIKSNHNDDNLPDVIVDSEEQLSIEELTAFRSLFDRKDDDISAGEKSTLNNIVFCGWCLRKL
mmetsp:Transcript_18443/g.16708  ORF Transcript_18443/g.16708 Transcript_18443/m.16708 type:complete len:156 (+) Transcript_18443:63-530(+)